MATQALVTFLDKVSEVHILKHRSGDPTSVADRITASFERAWSFPKFDASEFAASFVVYSKDKRGGIRILPTGPWKNVAPADIRFRYVVSFMEVDSTLHVEAYAVHWDHDTSRWYERELFTGLVGEMANWAKKEIEEG